MLFPLEFRASLQGACGDLTLRLLHPDDAVADYAAVLAAAHRIRGVFGPSNDWPPADLTLEENTQDLVRHLAESQSNQSFAYSLWRDGDYAGCLYIKPFKSRLEVDARRGRFRELCYVWVSEGFALEDASIYAQCKQWVQDHFPLQGAVWPGREVAWSQWEAMARQSASMQVRSVASHPSHSFSKPVQARIRLLAGLGVEGDAHCGTTVKHRSRVAKDPTQPNLRQVHLLHAELHTELARKGFLLEPGSIGENILTEGIALLDLPVGTRLAIGASAVVEITGLRNPCGQLDHFMPGLLKAVLDHTPSGELVRKAGIMGIVLSDGPVQAGDRIAVEYPPLPHRRLERV